MIHLNYNFKVIIEYFVVKHSHICGINLALGKILLCQFMCTKIFVFYNNIFYLVLPSYKVDGGRPFNAKGQELQPMFCDSQVRRPETASAI